MDVVFRVVLEIGRNPEGFNPRGFEKETRTPAMHKCEDRVAEQDVKTPAVLVSISAGVPVFRAAKRPSRTAGV